MNRQTVTHLPIEALASHPSNIRDDLGDLTDLALSIREHGILQPVTVTVHPDGDYLLIAGHRRVAAARSVDLRHIPAIIRHGVSDEATQLVLMLVENCQRRDLNAIEKAEAFGALRNRGLGQAEIARRTGVSPATVSHYLTLLELDEADRVELRGGAITLKDAFTVLRERRAEARPRTPNVGQRGRPKGSKTKPYFSDQHRLASKVRGMCDHRGRVKVGTVGCGPCWEEAIRTDGGAVPEAVDLHEVDDALVRRILDGDYKTPCNPAEKREVLRRWTAGGRSAAELGRLTGWRPERYFRTSEHIAIEETA